MPSKKQISVGSVKIGGGAPISIQSMTNTNTEDVEATSAQIRLATNAGCDLIRVSCPTSESTAVLKKILKNSKIPVIADIHFNYKRAIEAIKSGVHCVRINPGNMSKIGIMEIVKAAKDHGGSIRIGINSGSIEKSILSRYKEPSAEAMVESAILNCKKLEDLGFFNFKVSAKSSDVRASVMACRQLSKLIDYPLHLGITESGALFPGTIKSAIGIGSLLLDGIGDTIRVSLSSNITNEIKAARQILKSLSLLDNCINIVSCPTCSRTLISIINISEKLEDYCESMKKRLKISILGCGVNGVGEAMNSDIGVFGFQKGMAKIYLRGMEYRIVKDSEILKLVKCLIDEF
jgi:(E)-4-hydroxy-3-methylbut-2-enyl-diphosphate synthase